MRRSACVTWTPTACNFKSALSQNSVSRRLGRDCYLVPMGFQERLTCHARGHQAAEAGALSDVLVGTAKGVLNCLACGLGFTDVLVDFGQLALREPPPFVDGNTV